MGIYKIPCACDTGENRCFLRSSNDKYSLYYITSLDCDDLQYIVRGVRNHWHVENKLHYQLDVTFREDHSQVKIGHAPENMAVLRQMALNLLKGVDPKISMKRRRMLCAWDKRYLLKILFGLDEIKII